MHSTIPGYPDCRPEYVKAFQTMANLATRRRGGHDSHPHPDAALSTHQAAIVQLGLSLGVDYSITLSCYDPSPEGVACGHCDACQLRLKGFTEAGVSDPAPYVAR